MISRVAVDVARQIVDHRLGHVADHRQAAAHVAVERAVADGELALVAGGEQQVVVLVGERHQDGAADAGLDVLLGDVGLASREAAGVSASRYALEDRRRSGRRGTAMPRFRASASASATEWSDEYRVGIATPVTFPAQGRGGEGRGERRVDAAGEAEHDGREAALAHVVAQAEDERAVDLLLERRADRAAREPRALGTASAASWHVDDDEVLLEVAGAQRSSGRVGSKPIEWPSKISSSLPPTWLT